MSAPTVLVLGAYGLAGRAIVEELVRDTSYLVYAAGRSAEKLGHLQTALDSDRVRIRVLDAQDRGPLRSACDEASLVINAVGPYCRYGVNTARTAIECGLSYIDCANEQDHFQRLQTLDAPARDRKVSVVTAAGAIPGCSTMLIADLLERFPGSASVDCYWAHRRLPRADAGLGSVMGGILEVAHRPLAVASGELRPVVVGRSVKSVVLPDPFGACRMVEVPTIDSLTLHSRYTLQEFHSWFYFGDLPASLLGIIRLLHPERRPGMYRLIERILQHLNERDTNRAIASGIGPEGLLMATVRSGSREMTSFIVFRDGAQATARLPVLVARACLDEARPQWGVHTPLDLFRPAEVLTNLGTSVVTSNYASGS